MLRAVRTKRETAAGRTWVRFRGCRHEILFDLPAEAVWPGGSLFCPRCARRPWSALITDRTYKVIRKGADGFVGRFVRYTGPSGAIHQSAMFRVKKGFLFSVHCSEVFDVLECEA